MTYQIGKTVGLRQGLKRSCAAIYRGFGDRLRPGELVIPTYHSVQANERFSISPEMFERQMEYLAENFKLPSLDQWLQRTESDESDDRPAAIVSFDDGYENFFRFAYPVLQRLKIPAVIFVTTGFVTGGCGVEERLAMYGELKPLNWEQLKEIRRGGMTIGSHTHGHIHLGQATRDEVADELNRSKQILEEQLNSPVRHFAYPWGQRRHIGVETIPLLQQLDYESACSTLWGRNTRQTDRYLLHRVRIDSWDNFKDFRAKVQGDWDFIGYYHRVK